MAKNNCSLCKASEEDMFVDQHESRIFQVHSGCSFAVSSSQYEAQQASILELTIHVVENDNAQRSEESTSDSAIYRFRNVFCECSRSYFCAINDSEQESEESGYQTAEPTTSRTTSPKKYESPGLSKLLSSMCLCDEPHANKPRRKNNELNHIRNRRGRSSCRVQKNRQTKRPRSSGGFIVTAVSPNDKMVNGSANEDPETRVDEALTPANGGRNDCDDITDHPANNSTPKPIVNRRRSPRIEDTNNTITTHIHELSTLPIKTPQLASTPKLTNHQVRNENAQCKNKRKSEVIMCRRVTCERCSTTYHRPIDTRNDSVIQQESEYPTVVESKASSNDRSSVFSWQRTMQSTMTSEYTKYILGRKGQGDFPRKISKLCPWCERNDTKDESYNMTYKTETAIELSETRIEELTDMVVVIRRNCDCGFAHLPPKNEMADATDTSINPDLINSETVKTEKKTVKAETAPTRWSERLANISNRTTTTSHNNKPQNVRR